MIDRYKDNYSEPNYTRLFLLFILFLVSLYFRLGSAAETIVNAGDVAEMTTEECILAGLDYQCNVKK